MEDGGFIGEDPRGRVYHKSVNINSSSDLSDLIEEEFLDLKADGHTYYNHMWYNRDSGEVKVSRLAYPDMSPLTRARHTKERWTRIYILNNSVAESYPDWVEMCQRALQGKRVIEFASIGGVPSSDYARLWAFGGVTAVRQLDGAARALREGRPVDIYRDRWGDSYRFVGPGFEGALEYDTFICSLQPREGPSSLPELVNLVAGKTRAAVSLKIFWE